MSKLRRNTTLSLVQLLEIYFQQYRTNTTKKKKSLFSNNFPCCLIFYLRSYNLSRIVGILIKTSNISQVILMTQVLIFSQYHNCRQIDDKTFLMTYLKSAHQDQTERTGLTELAFPSLLTSKIMQQNFMICYVEWFGRIPKNINSNFRKQYNINKHTNDFILRALLMIYEKMK